MNFFLDTNILFNDPFLKGNHNQQIVSLVRRNLKIDRESLEGSGFKSNFLHEKSKIYLSSVVYEEVKNKYFNKIEELFKLLDNFDEGIKEYMDTEEKTVSPFSKEQCKQKFVQYYEDLQKEGIVEILEPYDNITKDLIDRAVNKKPPFFNGKKNEFRDAVLWLTYSFYVKENNLENCYFITNNSNDFFDLDCKDNVQLHPELLKDCNRFTTYRSIKELVTTDEGFKNRSQMYIQIIHHLHENIHDIMLFEVLRGLKDNLNREYVLELINDSDYLYQVEKAIHHAILNAKFDSVDSHNRRGFYEPYTDQFKITDLEIDDKEIIQNSILVSCKITVPYDMGAYVFNPGYGLASEDDDDMYELVAIYGVEFIVPISFFINFNHEISNFECETPGVMKPIIEKSIKEQNGLKPFKRPIIKRNGG
ncbi:PIN domain-containing protein [Bacillus subtilis]|uniref:PIN domain-containing protein n=1 Tax=Bacillus subtilis TaxID=1423 RepID=UPI001B9E3A9C|nr:PIN domain-containing protein [Bacillus subtilis]CAF1853815.1 hypothetical protein NRS6145_03940 [Bacillus subtilis]CAI6329541.1 hypothetical protein NRS6145_20895 [Bacillus subtilis]